VADVPSKALPATLNGRGGGLDVLRARGERAVAEIDRITIEIVERREEAALVVAEAGAVGVGGLDVLAAAGLGLP